MRKTCLFSITFVLVGAVSGSALETIRRTPGASPGDFPAYLASSSVTIAYYNLCTGAVWNWSNLPPRTTYGVRYDDVTPRNDVLLRTHIFYGQGAPAGYGFTSTAQVLGPFEPRCPDISVMGTRFFLPQDGWNTIQWGDEGIPVEDFWVLVTHSAQPLNPTVIVTERGSDLSVPGRPGGCGPCFNPDRTTHSWYLGSTDKIVCPAGPWFDSSPCWLELVWTSEFRSRPVSIREMSWGRVKGLYR